MRRVVVLLLLLASCKSGEGTAIPGGGSGGSVGTGGTNGGAGVPGAAKAGSEVNQYFELDPVRDLDLVFVVGNGPGMAARQKELARNLPALFEALGQAPGGMPNLHVGVVSSDLGAGSKPLLDNLCPTPGGDRGILQAGRCGLTTDSRFLASLNNGTQNNFTGALADAAACLVQVGESGCPYSHELQATRVALYESVTKENTGFLRDGAFLAIVLLTDVDDCSGETNSDLFTDDASFPMTTPALRCSQVGHVCDGKSPPVGELNASLESCQARDGGRLIRVRDIVDSIRALKKRPDQQIMMTAIAGSPADHPGARYQYVAGAGGKLSEASLCAGDPPARVGLRIRAMVDGFGEMGQMLDVCNPDLSAPVRAIGDQIGDRLHGLCLAARPLDADAAAGLQARCQASLLEPSASGGYKDRAIPSCADGGPRPCLRIVEKPTCMPSGYAAEIDRTGATVVPGTQVSLHCASEAMVSEPGPAPPPEMCPLGACPRRSLGQLCSLGGNPPLNQSLYRSDAPECPSGVCLKPARDVAVAAAVDTAPTCTKACMSDLDCADAEVRDPTNGQDRRCKGGYACAVPFEVGSLCCRKLCVCKDFLPKSGVVTPASCASSSPASACRPRP